MAAVNVGNNFELEDRSTAVVVFSHSQEYFYLLQARSLLSYLLQARSLLSISIGVLHAGGVPHRNRLISSPLCQRIAKSAEGFADDLGGKVISIFDMDLLRIRSTQMICNIPLSKSSEKYFGVKLKFKLMGSNKTSSRLHVPS
jgi:hypothetical protein